MSSEWTLHIDAEGYPVMDGGIRGDDPEFLEIVFKNLRRYKGDDKFPLCTEMNGKEVLLSSFDDPLVAQEVLFEKNKLVWNFLGNLSFEVSLDELRVDEWNRLHAYVGPERIPAVMSHRAQAAFLLKFVDLASLKPSAYRSTVSDLSASRWNQPYVDNEMPWDMGGVNPVIAEHSKRMLEQSGNRYLVPGAGTGHEVSFLEKASKSVTALDFSPQAKDKFLEHYPNCSAKYIVGDFFTESLEPFDAALELAFFVAIDPGLRSALVKRMHSLLKPGGFWGGSFFTRYSEEGPPFGLSEWELKQHVQEYFEVIEWQRSPYSHPRRKHMELWALFKKKS
ncbi:MAG: methyltransferase domain-containing protein [Bdellovibrionota bacterium]